MPHANELLIQKYLFQMKLLCFFYEHNFLTLSGQAQAQPGITGNMNYTWRSTAASPPIDQPSAFSGENYSFLCNHPHLFALLTCMLEHKVSFSSLVTDYVSPFDFSVCVCIYLHIYTCRARQPAPR